MSPADRSDVLPERPRRVLIVHAHPEPASLNSTLKTFMEQHLRETGHEVQTSDLYAMGWKSALDAGDFMDRDPDARLDVVSDSRHAFDTRTQTPDVVAEQEKLRWADALILQFPLWWFTMPAILKGWVDRVFANGFAYGVGEHSDERWGDRYGEGVFVGKRAMLSVTAGGWDTHYGPRGINGPIEDLLFPINHGVLYYPGFEVLPPFVVYRPSKLDTAGHARIRARLAERLDSLWTQPPIAYRMQNGGAYDIPALTLKPGLERPGSNGFAMHIAEESADQA